MQIPHISIKNASLSYQEHLVFSGLELEIAPKQWLALLGKSGVGKSSLLHIIAGLNHPQACLKAELHADSALPIQDQIAYMAQADLLLPWLNLLDNVLLSAKLKGQNTLVNREKALFLLEKVGLVAKQNHYPHQLSGGMRQRAALARTLLQEKPIVLMDEPFSSVDAITRYELQNLSAELLKDKTVLFITHDPSEALRLASDIYIMQGKPATLKHWLHLDTPAPRALSLASLTQLQTQLFHALSEAL